MNSILSVSTSTSTSNKAILSKIEARNAEPLSNNGIEEPEIEVENEKPIASFSNIVHQTKKSSIVSPINEDVTPRKANHWIRNVKSFLSNSFTHQTSNKKSETAYLLPPRSDSTKKCLVLDLDETLIHSFPSYTPFADFSMQLELEEGIYHRIYVAKRQGVDEFLQRLSKVYEIVIFTASLPKYANPLIDHLDPTGELIKYRLFRQHCVHFSNAHVKDLSLLKRPLSETIIVDNSPLAYSFHYQNAIPCASFYDDANDMELYDIMEFLLHIENVADVRQHLGQWRRRTNRY